MDALILCGGFAKRLEPITEFIPKPLLYVKGKPLIEYILSSVLETGPKRIVISTNKKFAAHFSYWISTKRDAGIRNIELAVEPVIDNEEKLGAVKGIAYAIRNANLDDDLLIVAGDNYFEFDINGIKNAGLSKRRPVIALYDVKSIDDAKMFGVVKLGEDGKIQGFEEKPEKPQSTLVSTGIYFFPKECLKRFQEYIDSGTNPDAIGYFVEWLIKTSDVYGQTYAEGLWYDIGNLTTYRKLFYTFL